MEQLKRGSLKGIFVTQDDPTFLEDAVDPEQVILDLNGQNVNELRDAYVRKQAGYSTTPFDPLGHRLRLFPGGITIWSGFPGSGKTTLLRQLTCHLLHSGQGVFFASLEEDPRDLLVRVAGVAAGRETPTEADLEWFLFDNASRLKVWGVIGLAHHQQILATIRVLARHGIRHAIIDSLMCLDVNSTDWEAQRQFATALAATARLSGTHIHLVAHPRKLVSADQAPDINDVAGSADLGRLADNVVFVRRATNEATISGEATPMAIAVRKQRHGTGSTGDITGWFHRGFRQFHVDQFAAAPIQYLPPEAYGAHA
jgi:twinkle protein